MWHAADDKCVGLGAEHVSSFISMNLRFLAAAFVTISCSAFAQTEICSVDSSGAIGLLNSADPSVSADGRYVVFASESNTLAPNDFNITFDIFLRDRWFGTTERLSLDSNGVGGDGASVFPSISPDARFIAFTSQATNLVAADTNHVGDVFVRDRLLGITERVSVSTAGSQGNGISERPSISADGRYVAFQSAATNLVAGDTNSATDIFVRDRLMGTTTRASVSHTGAQAAGVSSFPVISADGKFVVFMSFASNLVAGDTNFSSDIFLRDMAAGSTERVSLTHTGQQIAGGSLIPAITPDARWIGFQSSAANIVPGDTNQVSDVFVHDRVTLNTIRVSISSTGVEGNLASSEINFSAGGKIVSFSSLADNLVDSDLNGSSDVFTRNLDTNITERVSTNTGGVEGDDSSYDPFLSPDAQFIVYESSASNFVAGDTNLKTDIFLGTLVGPQAPHFSDLGNAATGSYGLVQLTASGVPVGGGEIAFHIENAERNTVVYYIGGGSRIDLPVLAGVLVPYPDVLFVGTTDQDGKGTQSFIWPAGLPAEITAYFQALIVDPGAPFGLSFSNAVSAKQLY